MADTPSNGHAMPNGANGHSLRLMTEEDFIKGETSQGILVTSFNKLLDLVNQIGRAHV